MIRRRPLPGERTELYSPIGLIPTDAFTGGAPIGRLRVFLDIRDPGGIWRQTKIEEVRTLGGAIAYPGLGRSARVASPPAPLRHRVRLEAEFYQPLYHLTLPGGTADGIEFDVFPYNDASPPPNAAKLSIARNVMLAPATNYPFPHHVRVLRGVVLDRATNLAVPGAEVSWKPSEFVLTDARGTFALPLRVTRQTELANRQLIAASRAGKTGLRGIFIPRAVGRNLIIKIS